MSEPKTPGQTRYEELLNQISELTKKMEAFKPPIKENTTSSSKLEDAFEHVHTCPTCKAKLDKEKEDYAREHLQKTLKERKTLPYMCKDCGLGVAKTEEACPGCGGQHAEKR